MSDKARSHYDDDNDDHDGTAGRAGAAGGEDRSGGMVDVIAAMAPGPELAVALAGIDISVLSAHDVIVVAQAFERLKAHVDALQLFALAELAARPEYARCTYPDDAEVAHNHRAVQVAGGEVSLALSWTPTRATAMVVVATELVHDLPDTLAALADGRIDVDKARLIADRTRCLTTPDARRAVERVVLPVAERKTRGVLDAALRREVIAADPDAAETRRAEAVKKRRVGRPEPASPGGEDSMAQALLYGPGEDLTAFWVALDAAARYARTGGDERTLDQLRFDILTGLGWSALELGHLGCCNPTCTGHPAPTPRTGTGTGTGTAGAAAAGSPSGPARDAGDADRAASEAGSPFGPTTTAAGTAHARPANHTGHADRAGDTKPAHDPDPGTSTGAGVGAGPAGTHAGRGPGDTRAHAGAGAAGGVLRLGTRRGKPATVGVTVPFTALAGHDESPGWLDGYGPITATACRRIAAEGTLRRMLTDPADGHLLEYGRTTYTPPAELAAFVAARDRTCRFPTCNHPASESEIDHKIPYGHGGTTGKVNTWSLHQGHHMDKTCHGFRISTDSHGVTWWITPAGHTYPVDPEIIGPILRTHKPTSPTDPDPEPAPF